MNSVSAGLAEKQEGEMLVFFLFLVYFLSSVVDRRLQPEQLESVIFQSEAHAGNNVTVKEIRVLPIRR